MKFKHILLYFLLVTVLSGEFLVAQTQEADAVFRDVVIEYQLKEDGSTVYNYSHKLKLLTNKAFRRTYGETFIVYNPQFQKLTINRSETTMKDGKVVPSPENAFNEVLPRFAANAPAFNHLREMVVTHTALEIGAEIALSYQIETKSDFVPGLTGEEILDNNSPVENAVIRIIIPSDKDLQYELFNHSTEPEINTTGNRKVYQWNFNKLKAIYPERNTPSTGNFAPCLVFSTFEQSNEVFSPLIAQKAFQEPDDEELSTLVHRLKEKTTSDLDFILALQQKVADEISTYHIPLIHTGIFLRNPLDVWKSNGGTVLEKAVLMAALLKKAGFEGTPVLITENVPFSKKAVSFQVFHEARVHTQLDGKCLILPVDHPVHTLFTYELAGRTIAILNNPDIKIKSFPVLKAEDNRAVLSAVLKLEEGVLSGEARLLATGTANPYFDFYRNDKKLKNMITGTFKSSDSEEWSVLTLSPEKTEGKSSVKVESPFTENGEYLFWNIPENPCGFDGWHWRSLSQERLHPVSLPHPLLEENKINIILPEDMKLVSPPVKIQIDNNVGALTIEITEQHGVVQIIRSLTLNTHIVSVADYKDLLELWRVWKNKTNKELCFKKK